MNDFDRLLMELESYEDPSWYGAYASPSEVNDEESAASKNSMLVRLFEATKKSLCRLFNF